MADALGILSSRLVADDRKSAESACLALSRLAESCRHDAARLRQLAATADVLSNLQRILLTSPPAVGSNTFVAVLHVLVVMSAHGSGERTLQSVNLHNAA